MRSLGVIFFGASAILSACGGGGAPVIVAPSVTLNSLSASVNSGEPATLTWSATNANSCVASDGWSGDQAVGGTYTTGAIDASTTFTLTCTGAEGTSLASSVTVNVIPTATLTAEPSNVRPGSATTLAWDSTNATACAASGGWSGTKSTSGAFTTPDLSASTMFSLVCSGPGGSSATAAAGVTVTAGTPLPPPAATPPTVALSALPTTVALGGTTLLTWSSVNASSCSLGNGATNTAVSSSGSQVSPALTASATYSLTCTGIGGNTTSAPVTIAVTSSDGATLPPVVTITASPATVASGHASTLTWSSTNSPSSCTASGGWTGSEPTSGIAATPALKATTTYSLTCSNASGRSAVGAATVIVEDLPVITLTAAPATIASGHTSTLTWSSSNAASSCNASGGWGGAKPASGNTVTSTIRATTTYSLNCSNAAGTSAVVSATVTVEALPVVTLTASPTAVTSGGTSILTWSSSSAATSCDATGGWSGTRAPSGTKATAALTSSTLFSLTCANVAGRSAVASVTVSVKKAMVTSLSPKIVALTLTRTQQFTATLPDTTATWTVDGVVGGNATLGTVSSAGLYTAGYSPGQYTVTATSGADATTSATGIAAVTNLAGVFSYHNDLSRDGANLMEYALTKTNVTTGFGKLASCPVDGAVYAQPLWVANVIIAGNKHNVVYVATEHDRLFAFDADPVNSTCMQLWSADVIDAVHGAKAGETSVPNGPTVTPRLIGVGSGDLQPEVGITGTPVIDPATNILYVVSKSVSADKATFYQRLHAINISTGTEMPGSPIVIAGRYTPTGGSTVEFNAQLHLQRAGLTLANGKVYVAFAAHEDKAPWYGWMMSYSYTGTGFTQSSVLNVSPVKGKGGIWMSGGAPAADASGNMYFITGNGVINAYNGGLDHGNSMMKVSPSLAVLGYYTPSTEVANDQLDEDLGAGGAAILADLPEGNTVRHAMIFGGKETRLFVVDRDNPGGYDANDSTRIQDIAFGNPIFATGALWNNTYYLAGAGGPLKSFSLNTSTAQFALSGQSASTYGFPGSTPSVSSANTADGIVWTLDTTGAYCTNQARTNPLGRKCSPGVLHAHDAANVGTELWNSSKTTSDAAGFPLKFNVVTVANGHAYIGTRGNDCSQNCPAGVTPTIFGTLDIYGLKP